jgi:hypothetical protein
VKVPSVGFKDLGFLPWLNLSFSRRGQLSLAIYPQRDMTHSFSGLFSSIKMDIIHHTSSVTYVRTDSVHLGGEIIRGV